MAVPTLTFFREHGRWHVYAADAGADGDCFFLSLATILMQARGTHPELRALGGSIETTNWDDRVCVVASL